jgi:hypothetical protein
MDTRPLSSRSDITFANTSSRVTPTPPRATRFGEVLSNTVVRSAESAMRVLPGSPMMALAVRGGSGATGAAAVPMKTMSNPAGPMPVVGPAPSPVGAGLAAAGINVAGVPSGGSATGGQDGGIESSLQQSQDMNLYYLQIQESVNAENRSFTALSNVMKAEHETVKTAIGNIR